MKRLLLPILVIILLLAAFIAGRRSVKPKPVDLPRIDSLVTENEWLQIQVREQQFIMNDVISRKDSLIMVLTVDKNHFRSRARDHEASAQFWLHRFQDAKEAGDTCVAMANYETIIADHQQYVYNASRQMDAADSIIDAQFAIIQEQQRLIDKQKQELANAALLITQYKAYTTELRDSLVGQKKKEKRRKLWSNVKLVLGIGIGTISQKL